MRDVAILKFGRGRPQLLKAGRLASPNGHRDMAIDRRGCDQVAFAIGCLGLLRFEVAAAALFWMARMVRGGLRQRSGRRPPLRRGDSPVRRWSRPDAAGRSCTDRTIGLPAGEGLSPTLPIGRSSIEKGESIGHKVCDSRSRMAWPISPSFDFEIGTPRLRHSGDDAVSVSGVELRLTPVFYAYWYFAAERQRIFFRRLQNREGPLTKDPVLRNFKFTNAYRASDRVSQYLIRNVIYRDDLPSDECNTFFRILLFKLFNKIETWRYLEDSLGPLTWAEFNFKNYDALLSRRLATGERIYSAAYIMPSGGRSFEHKLKHQNHLRMIEYLMREGYPARLSDCKGMEEAFALLRTVPFLGPFLAYQFVTDLNYSRLTEFREDEFVVAGPGALDGIAKCFLGADAVNSANIIRYMWEHQDKHFADLGIEFPSLWGRPLQLIDCQNIFCEISKYARVAFPDYAGIAGRTRIKQKFRPRGELPSPWYPPKWNIDTHGTTP